MAKRGGTELERRARGDRTRRDLIEAGRTLFVEKGYFDTSIAEMVATAGVGTRGAFYHHFKDKATTSRTRPSFSARCSRRSSGTSRCGRWPLRRPAWTPGNGSARGCTASSSRRSSPKCNASCCSTGPVVLGWQNLRAIQEGNSIALINEMVRVAIAEGTIDDLPITELTHMLVASLEEGATLVAHAKSPGRARTRAAKVLDRLLLSFATEPGKVLRR